MCSEPSAKHLGSHEIAATSPSMQSGPRRPSLPHWRTPLIGRDRVVADIVGLLRQDGVSFLNLTGPGGVGKTRLAVAVASAVSADYPDGVGFVALDSIQDAKLVLPTIASFFGLSDSGSHVLPDRLIERLRPLELLLILDNVEHVFDAVPDISRLLSSCPSLTIISTSRVVLHITGEHDFRVDPLTLPSAVELFVARARAANPAFAITAGSAATVARICTRLDGVPLALELAAARTAALPPTALLARLDQALPMLTSGARDQPDRLRTMRNAISWSHDLLTPEEQDLFRRLSVFVSSFPLDAALALARNQPDAIDAIGSLVEKSILRLVGEGPDPEPRYQMLETVREFGLERLEESGDAASARRSHATWFVELAETAKPMLDGGDQVKWQERLESELPNIRLAMDWSTDQDIDLALRLGASLGQFWIVRGNLAEARRALDRVLASGAGEPSLHCRALLAAAWIRFAQADAFTCLLMAESALDQFRSAGDRQGVADALIAVGFCLDHMGQDARDPDMTAGAVQAMLESRSIAQTTGDRRTVAMATYGLASLSEGQGDIARALELFSDALAGFEDCNDVRSVGWTVSRIGVIAATTGDTRRAAAAFERGLPIFQALRDLGSAVLVIMHVARVALSMGRPGEAAQLLAASDTFRAVEGLRAPVNESAERSALLQHARGDLGEKAYSAAIARGRSLSIEEAI
ncbi:MAG TPA: AAA family ATPase, partial [Thermomicrobiales bacterium]|nr:AAA family ATPase [Thermomicrobiales bacterium]